VSVGLGLRRPHYRDIVEGRPSVSFFEVLVDNFVAGGPGLTVLELVAEHYPVCFHSTGMSLGSTDPLNLGYLREVRRLVERFQPTVLSDHLCWSGVAGIHGHDLYPLPFTARTVAHVAERIRTAQDLFGRRLAIENVSAYVGFADSTLSEADFLAEVAEAADCDILLDVNNVYVNERNLGIDPHAYVRRVPAERVVQYHLSGHSDEGTHVVDSHDSRVVPAVWDLYREALRVIGPRPTSIEWDNAIPPLNILLEERERAVAVVDEVAS